MLKPLLVAFAMYSKIPVPTCQWDEKSMRYALCFFPMVGVVIGVIYTLMFDICVYMRWSGFLKGSLLMVVPLLITGGIHADGFVDTVDAVSSYKNREGRLEILKDPHVGAFGIIWTVAYFMLYAAFSSVLTKKMSLVVAGGFVISRALSALAAITIKNAKNNGTLYVFTSSASNTVIMSVTIVFVFLAVVFSIKACLGAGIISAALAVAWLLLFKFFALKNFGGITGDLAGFFLQTCEMLLLIGAVVGGRIW